MSYPPKNKGCSKYRTNLDKQHTDYCDNTYQTGLVGVRYFQLLMAQRNINAIYIDHTYDVILPEKRYAVELKTRRPEGELTSTGKKSSREYYVFSFTVSQVQKNSFDYAVCIGCDNDYNPKAIYIIPQRYIYEQAKKDDNLTLKEPYSQKNKVSSDKQMVKIRIPTISYPKDGPRQALRHFDVYDKWEICKNRLDVFEIENKSTFTRIKNKMYHNLINFSKEQKELLLLKVKELWKQGFTHNVLANELGITRHTLTKYKKELNIFGKNPNGSIARGHGVKYTCQKCGYTTNDKSKITRHYNRKTPCGDKK